jgi:PadR family transcriptional regulator AphA
MTKHSKRHGSLSPEFALLGFLYEHPSHGYELHQKFASELGSIWHISQSQTYNILERLETQGHISSTTLKQDKWPSRQVLQITRKGRDWFNEWLDSPPNSSIRSIRVEFITRLYFVKRSAPEKIQPLLDKQCADINATLTNLELSQSETPADQTFRRLSLRLRIRQLHSALDWLSECRKALA